MKKTFLVIASAIAVLGLTAQVALGTIGASEEDSTLPTPVNLAASAAEGTATTSWGIPDEASSVTAGLSARTIGGSGEHLWIHPWTTKARSMEQTWTTAVPPGTVYEVRAYASYPGGDFSSRVTTEVVCIAPVVRTQNYLPSRLKKGRYMSVRLYAYPRVSANTAGPYQALPVRNKTGVDSSGYPKAGRVKVYVEHKVGRSWKAVIVTTAPWVPRLPKSSATYRFKGPSHKGYYRVRWLIYLDRGFTYRGGNEIRYTTRTIRVY